MHHYFRHHICAACWVVSLLPQTLTAPPSQGSNPYFAPYLASGELPNGTLLPLYRGTWRITGNSLDESNFTAVVSTLAETIFSAYAFHGQLDVLQPSEPAPTVLDGQPVDKSLLAGDTFSNTALQNYSSVTVHFNISIDNTAWYPNLGSVVKTNHDRLSTIMRSMGYSVVSWITSSYHLEPDLLPVLHRMPIPQYVSYQSTLQVTGANVVPFTIQKQNLVTAVLSELLASVEVWQLRCLGVSQTLLDPGSSISTANLTYELQQSATALFVGQALTSIVTDSLGTPLFQAQMAAAGLPVSAAVGDTVYLPGVSVTDQISSYHPLSSKASAGKIAGIVIGSVACIALIATVLGLICLCRRKRQGIFTHQKGTTLPSDAHRGLSNEPSGHETFPASAKGLVASWHWLAKGFGNNQQQPQQHHTVQLSHARSDTLLLAPSGSLDHAQRASLESTALPDQT